MPRHLFLLCALVVHGPGTAFGQSSAEDVLAALKRLDPAGDATEFDFDREGHVEGVWLPGPVTVERLKLVGGLGKVRKLDVYMGYDEVTPEELRQVVAIKSLESVTFDSCRFPKTDLSPLGKLPALRELDFGECYLTDVHAVQLGKVTRITKLALYGCLFTDDGIAALKPLEKLEDLDLDRGGLSDDRPGITDAALATLSGFKALERLNLTGANVTDAGLVSLAKSKSLRKLDLGETKITDAGLTKLVPLKTLEELDVSGTKVTKAGIERFSKALPDCRITGP